MIRTSRGRSFFLIGSMALTLLIGCCAGGVRSKAAVTSPVVQSERLTPSTDPEGCKVIVNFRKDISDERKAELLSKYDLTESVRLPLTGSVVMILSPHRCRGEGREAVIREMGREPGVRYVESNFARREFFDLKHPAPASSGGG